MTDWGLTEIILLISLVPLVLTSGFFSGSETALFGLSHNERLRFRKGATLAGRAVETLMADERLLLITVLLGNMVANVLFFVFSSVLLLRLHAGVVLNTLAAIGTLLLLVLLGEVLPKMLANTKRMTFAGFIAPPLLTLHGLITPLRIVLDRFIVSPLSRLTAPRVPPQRLDERELREMLELSGEEGAIDSDERRMLRDVIKLGRMKVSDVMTPRVKVSAIPVGAARDDVRRLARETRLTRLPVIENDLDHVLGVLHVRRFLVGDQNHVTKDIPEVVPPSFVPEMATLEKLLEEFRAVGGKSAIVVDEYGGTSGVVSIEDVVEEIVGDIIGPDETPDEAIQSIGLGVWRVRGDMSLHDWAETFDLSLRDTPASTLSGFLTELLGRAAEVGDVLHHLNLRIEVEQVRGMLITSAVMQRIASTDDDPIRDPEA